MSRTGGNKFGLARLGSCGGFTLVEMMVVIVVIGLMSSLVVLNLPAGRPSLDDEAARLAARFSIAGREAVMRGETVGVVLTREGYRFLRQRGHAWQPFDLVPGRADIRWPEDMEVSFVLAGERQALPRRAERRPDEAPFLVFTATSQSIPFDLYLHRDDRMAHVSGDGISQIRVEQ